MLRQSLFIILLSLMIWGCKDDLDVEEPVEPAVSWLEDERFLFETKVQFNTHADGERIHFMGRDHFSTIELAADDTTEVIQHAFHWLNYNQHGRMPITDELFITASQNIVRIASTLNPVLQGASQYINLAELDPDFAFIETPSFWMSEAIAVNEENVCLIPYHYRLTDNIGGIRVLKVKVALNEFMTIAETEIITISDSGFPIRSIYAFGNDFLITDDRNVFFLDQNNQITVAAEFPVSNLFQINGQWFGIRGEKLYRTVDGRAWTEAGTINPDLGLVSYDQLVGKTIGVFNSQIFLFELEGDQLQISELNNDGLFGHEITSVDVFNGKVYAATLSGVFVKDLEHFWEERVQEEG
ncbi:MAG: hypothetical protein R8G66_27205 [Cytophagales bacterium]|nr:hypothetical protein [Cytophagales bacterium]